MKVVIDEQKIKPELVFNQNGIEVYRYNQPLYLYFYNDDTFEPYKTRVARYKDNHRLFKVSCLYRVFLTNDTFKTFKEKGEYQIHQYGWDNEKFYVSTDKKTLFYQKVKELTGFTFDYSTNCFHVTNGTKTSSKYLDEIMFLKSDMKEITTVNAKEKRLEKERAKKQMLEQLFMKQIEAVAKDNGMYQSYYDKARIGLSDKAIQELIDNYIQNVIKEFNDLGLKATICNNRFINVVKVKAPMIKVELGDDIVNEGE